jgi:hypothetical protein
MSLPQNLNHAEGNSEVKTLKITLACILVIACMFVLADYVLPALQGFAEAGAERARPKPPANLATTQATVAKQTPAQLRETLSAEYHTLVAEQYSHLNGVGSKTTKTKGGYGIWATHEFFGRYTFSAGRQARVIDQWVFANRARLQQAEIKQVGVMSSDRPFGDSSCWFDV